MVLEELNSSFSLFCLTPGLERPEIPAFPGAGILLARVQAILPVGAVNCASDNHDRLLRREAIPGNCILELPEGNVIARFEVHISQTFVQADVYILYSVNTFKCHAHGVGADLSIHAEDSHLDVAVFGLGR